MTAERLQELRGKKPDPEAPDFSRMQQHFDAGLLQCLGSRLPVINPRGASVELQQELWRLFCSLADALNSPSAEHSTKAIASCRAVKDGLVHFAPHRARVPHST